MGSLIDSFELPAWSRNELVLGIDEAGRGPMAGPLVVCGVIFPIGFYHPDINDSKKLTDTKRQALVDIIKDNAVWFDLRVVSVEAIDKYNIYRATQMTMESITNAAPAERVYTDAMPLLNVSHNWEAIIKGDARSMTIAAASILAKTYRDAIMLELDAEFPEYKFKNNKGYGTKDHKSAILAYGRTPHHRTTFKFKDEDQISLDI